VKEVAEKYFKLFSAKDLDALDPLFDGRATLRDWEIQAEGKSNVFVAMKEIFDSVESIKVNPINMVSTVSPPQVIAELDIIVNNTEKLAVVDIIDFTDEGKILGIRAFKG
jgi:hypothetical protein